jgi:hypothetical protein
MTKAIGLAMRDRAYELGRSGDHDSYGSIESQVRDEFGRDPHFLFDSADAKREFDAICHRALQRKETP